MQNQILIMELPLLRIVFIPVWGASVRNITTTETPKNGQLVPEMAKRWIGARPASFRYLNSNEQYLV